jgi:hypothetical protein
MHTLPTRTRVVKWFEMHDPAVLLNLVLTTC